MPRALRWLCTYMRTVRLATQRGAQSILFEHQILIALEIGRAGKLP